MKNNRKYAAPPYHAHSIEQIQEDLEVDPERGLSLQQVEERLKEHGPNKLRETKGRSVWKILIEQFKSVVIIVLMIAGAAALTFQDWAEEGIAIVAVLLVNAGIAFVTELKAVRSMEALLEMG